MAFHPYLNFPGTCREALTRYQEVLGGELYIMGSADMPSNGEMPPDWDPDLVVHGALMLEDGMLMASDAPDMEGGAVGTYVHYEAKDVDDARRVHEALCEGGDIEMDFQETFWSPGFGSFRDRWGTLWMISAPSEFEMPS
jgi:PhnB protein